MTFLHVFEVPEHDKAIKKFVSVCLCVCVFVCLCVCVFVPTITPLTAALESLFWCQNVSNLKTKS
jgi:hypothetical protein